MINLANWQDYLILPLAITIMVYALVVLSIIFITIAMPLTLGLLINEQIKKVTRRK